MTYLARNAVKGMMTLREREVKNALPVRTNRKLQLCLATNENVG
jgi:hypothetical protein